MILSRTSLQEVYLGSLNLPRTPTTKRVDPTGTVKLNRIDTAPSGLRPVVLKEPCVKFVAGRREFLVIEGRLTEQ